MHADADLGRARDQEQDAVERHRRDRRDEARRRAPRTPRTTRSTPKAVIAAHFPRRRSIASPRLCADVPTFDAFDIAVLPAAKQDRGLARALEFAKHLRGIFDHRHDAAVVEPGRPDDAEHAGDAWSRPCSGAAIIDDPESENSLFSEPMKILTPSPVSARCKSSITSVLVSRSANRVRMRSRSSDARTSPIRLACPRTINWSRDSPPPGPGGEARFDQTGGDVVELLARVTARGFDLRRHFGQRAAANTRVEKVAGLDKRRRRSCRAAWRRRGSRSSRLRRPGSPERRRGLETHEFDVLEPRVDFARQHDARAARQFGQQARRFGERAFEARLPPPPPAPECRCARAPRAPRSPNSSSASTNSLRPCCVGSRPALACGA